MARKKVLIQSDFSLVKTGFAKNAKIILSYLYNTGKYDIVHYCCGFSEKSPELKRTPWKSIGCLPSTPEKLQEIEKDPTLKQLAAYGAYYIDEIIEKEKPDVYIAIQDIWGVDFAINKPWFNKLNSAIWTTLDSLPILPAAITAAPKVKNYWVWSNFATKELNAMGHTHVKTMHGALEDKDFYPLPKEQRESLRSKFGIGEKDFVIGFVFRNQLRKSVPNLLQGFKKFKKSKPESNAKLLLHTHMEEGWPILKLAKEQGIDENDILVSCICSKCFNYEVKPYKGPNQKCSHCNSEKSLNSTGVQLGVNESQLNEIYNLMDVYCHPFTSGGQEIPIQEAKLTELITLVTNYSCGAEMCEPEAHSLSLDWSEYREFGSNFIKASTCADSIKERLVQVFEMPMEERKSIGEKARKWVIDNFSIKYIGKQVEEFIDSCPKIKAKDFPVTEKKDPNAKIPEYSNLAEWIKLLYLHILKTKVDDDDEGLKYWLQELKNGAPQQAIENYFRNVALKDNVKNNENKFENIVDKDDEGKRILFILPNNPLELLGVTSFFESIKQNYPDYNLYVATNSELIQILQGNPYIHKIIPYDDYLSNPNDLEEKQYFNVVYSPQINDNNFHHFSRDKTNYSIV